ncbi:MAG: GNAT family N-acetyltransferase [Caldilineaceae bacterium]
MGTQKEDQMATFTIRKMRNSLADYQTLSKIERLMSPDDYGTVESWRDEYEGSDPNYLNETYFVEEKGQALASFQFHETPAMHVPGKVRIWQMVAQDASVELCETLVTALEERMAVHPINRAVGPVNEAYAALMATLNKHGYRSVLQQIDTSLNVSAFDPAPYAEEAERLAQVGIHIKSLAHLMESDLGWERKLYQLQSVARRDIPRKPGVKATDISIEQWRKFTFRSDFRPQLWMVAVTDDGEYVATGNLWLRDPTGTVGDNGFLGVLRPYRRRGVARTLKVALIGAAQAAGLHVINTGNETKQPDVATESTIRLR